MRRAWRERDHAAQQDGQSSLKTAMVCRSFLSMNMLGMRQTQGGNRRGRVNGIERLGHREPP